MSFTSRLLASSAVLLAAPAGTVLAADYDPPIYVEEAPEFVPVEIGSGWYLRGDLSYNAGSPVYDFTLLGESVSHNRIGGGLGVGYHFTDNLRGDITVNYLGGDSYGFNDGTDFVDLSHTVWSGLVSGYYDIATIAGFTPYVGAGVGLAYSKHEIDVAAPSVPLAASWSESQYEFAYALMAGASYRITDNASVDVGYQFLHTPGMEYLDTDLLTVRKGVQHHQIKVGLRYDLW
mgnify:CR=1 FL=1